MVKKKKKKKSIYQPQIISVVSDHLNQNGIMRHQRLVCKIQVNQCVNRSKCIWIWEKVGQVDQIHDCYDI